MANKDITSDSEISFEQAYKELEEIVDRIEQADQSLEKSLADFERGVSLMKICHASLNNAEQKVEKLVKDNQGLFKLEPFDS